MSFLHTTPRILRPSPPRRERAFAEFGFRAACIGAALYLWSPALTQAGDNSPNIIYVDQTATGMGDGTSWDDAFTSLADALDSAIPGDEVWVAEGLYFPEGNDPLRVRRIALRGGFAGTETSPSDRIPGAHPTRLSCDFAQDDVGDIFDDSRSENCWTVLIVEGDDWSNPPILEALRFDGSRSYAVYADSARVRRCEFRNVEIGILFALSEARNIVEDSQILGASYIGISASSSALIVRRTRIDQAGNYGIVLDDTYARIENSAITRSGRAGVDTWDFPTLPTYILNCTIVGGLDASVSGGGRCDIRNSILVAPDGGFTPGSSVVNSIVRPMSSAGISVSFRGMNVDLDPMFVDPENGDFRLRPGSPAIDAGHNDYAPNDLATDLDGNPRFIDDAGSGDCPHRNSTCGRGPLVDLGAYEFQGNSGEQGFSNSLDPIPRIYVDAAAKGLGTGLSWEDAHTSLDSALSLAPDGSDIWVAAGIYQPASTGLADPRSASFRIGRNLHVFGGFRGDEDALDDRPTGGPMTILSGDIGVAGMPDDNCYHVVTVPQEAFETTFLDQVAIREGNANGLGEDANGGGIVVRAGALRLAGCELTGNAASKDGGAVAVFPEDALPQDSPLIEIIDTAFLANSAGDRGGSLYVPRDLGLEIVRCRFEDNSARAAAALYQLRNRYSGARIVDSAFTRNVANVDAVASLQRGIFEYCTFRENRALDAGRIVFGQVANSVFDRNAGVVAIVRPFDQDPAPNPHYCTFYANTISRLGDAFVCEGNTSTCAYPGYNPHRMRDPENGEFSLLPRSAAIDAFGHVLNLIFEPPLQPIDLDLARNPRRVHDTGDLVSAGRPSVRGELWPGIDLGAFEFQGTSLFGDDNGNGEADLEDYAALPACLDGPSAAAADETRVNGTCIDVFGRDRADRIDLRSFAQFQNVFGPQP